MNTKKLAPNKFKKKWVKRSSTAIAFDDLHVQVLYAAAALFGSFTVFVLAISFLSHEPLGWSFFGKALVMFSCLWLFTAILIAILRKTPLILISGFTSLLALSGIGLLIFPLQVSLNDLLVILPLLFLWSISYYFFELSHRSKRRPLYLLLLLITLLALVTFIFLLVYTGPKTNVAVSDSLVFTKEYEELTKRGSFSFLTYDVNEATSDTLEICPIILANAGVNDQIIPKGKIYLPQGNGPFSLAIIHLDTTLSRPIDFGYLAEHLASRGIVTAIVPNFALNNHFNQDFNWVRGLALIEYINNLSQALPETLIDLENVALISFGEAVNSTSAAAYILQEDIFPLNGEVSVSKDITVDAIVAIAPSNQRNVGIKLVNIDYVALSGGYDQNSNLASDSLYNQVYFDSKEPHFKTQIYLVDGNRSYFINNNPGLNFPGYLLLNKYAFLDPNVQRNATKTLITAALEASLNYNLQYLEFFKSGKLEKLFGNLRLATRSVDAETTKIADFESGYSLNDLSFANTSLEIDNAQAWYIKTLKLNRALVLESGAEEVILSLNLPANFSKSVNLTSKSCFEFSLANLSRTNIEELYIEIETKRAKSPRIRLSELQSFPECTALRPYKLDFLNQLVTPKEFLQTFSIPLYRFFSSEDYTPWQDLQKIRLIIVPKNNDLTNKFLVDDIGFGKE